MHPCPACQSTNGPALHGLQKLFSALPIEGRRAGIRLRQDSEWEAVPSHRSPKADSRALRSSGGFQWSNFPGSLVADCRPEDGIAAPSA